MDRAQYTTLADALSGVPDPRKKRGVRHQWGLILTLIGAAMLAGQKQVHAVGQWVGEHTQTLKECLQTPDARLPSEATLRRALLAVDTEVLEARLGKFTSGLDARASSAPRAGERPLRGQSLDGKQVRGAGAYGRKVHLLSVVRHGSGIVLAQTQVGCKTNEIGAAPALLAGLDLPGTVTTMDALLAQRALAQQIVDGGGHYLMVIKANQPETLGAIAELFANPVWLPGEQGSEYWRCVSSGKAHGRRETRVLEASTSLNDWVRWPGVGQVVRRSCKRVVVKTGMVQEETSYAITSLSHGEADAAALEGYWRGHWGIENRVHWVRDVTMGEDAGQARTANAPQAMAALRNSIISLLRHRRCQNIADALRHYNAHPKLALALIGALPQRL